MMPTKKDTLRLLNIAKKAALLSGVFLFKNSRLNKKVNSEYGKDIKIQNDIESEEIIVNYLAEKSNFSILSEERGLIKNKTKDLMWIVDPLDGSFNYLRGIPFSCVSVGLWQENKPVLGALYDFNRQELFYGIARGGAWLNGIPLKPAAVKQKSRAVLCTGFPVNTDFSRSKINGFVKDICSYKKIRLMGSAALSIAYVACGRADIYYENDIMLWDVAGAIPVLLGSGGKLDIRKATRQYSYNVRVSNRYL